MSAIDFTREDVCLRFERAEKQWQEEKTTDAVSYQRDNGQFVIQDSDGRIASYTAIDLEAVR